MTVPEQRSDWRVEIPQRRPKDSAQVHQTLFLFGGGVWARDYIYSANCNAKILKAALTYAVSYLLSAILI